VWLLWGAFYVKSQNAPIGTAGMNGKEGFFTQLRGLDARFSE
jgi:hypothetical protein